MENKAKKQIPLRLSATLWEELSKWARDDFRSVNGQIEYLLHECVKARKKGKPLSTVTEEASPTPNDESK